MIEIKKLNSYYKIKLVLLGLLFFSISVNIKEQVGIIFKPFIGEFFSYSYFYIFIIIAAIYFFDFYKLKYMKAPKSFIVFSSLFILYIFFSGAVNASSILPSSFKGRSGIEKFILQVIVCFGVLIIIFFAYNLMSDLAERLSKEILFNYICKLFKFNYWFMIVYCFLQIFQLKGINIPLFTNIEFIVHGNLGYSRLRYLAYEASWFAVFTIPIYVFLLINFGKPCNTLKSCIKYIFKLLLFFLVMYYTDSRTAYVTTLLIFLIFLLLCYHYNIIKPYAKRIIVIFLPILTIGAIAILYKLIMSDSKIILAIKSLINSEDTHYNVSNMARYGMTMSAIIMGLNNPFGVGIGQYGFKFKEYFNMDFYTFEVSRWAKDLPNYPWPPVHNLYARFFAEIGIIGLIILLGFWLYMIFALLKRLSKSTSYKNVYIVALLSIFGCIISGFNLDNFINPLIWFSNAFCLFVLKYY